MRQSPPSRSLLLALLALLPGAALTAGPRLGAPDEVSDAVEEALAEVAAAVEGGITTLDRLEELSCAECHAEIAAEWASTSHAQAWVHEVYQEALSSKRRPQSCHGCHIPEPMHLGTLGRKPAPRPAEDEDHHFGVSCATCHEGPDGVVLGPWGEEQEAHASAQGDSFTDAAAANQLCISCHRTTIGPVVGIAKSFEITGQEGKGRSCVGCHMRAVERPIATREGEPTQARPGRSHRIQTPRDPGFLALAFGRTVAATEDGALVELTNHTGHNIPGLVDRLLDLQAEGLDADGEVVATAELRLTTRENLPVDESIELVLEGNGLVAVRLSGMHSLPGESEPVPFLDETHPLTP